MIVLYFAFLLVLLVLALEGGEVPADPLPPAVDPRQVALRLYTVPSGR